MRRALTAALICSAFTACGAANEARLLPASAIVRDTIPAPLTDTPGDAARGAAIFAEREAGHCVLCHVVDTLDAPFQGNIGPDLSGAGTRLSSAQLRLRIVDASILNPETVMPPYYRTHDLTQVGEAYIGRPALSGQDIEDLIAYLIEQRG